VIDERKEENAALYAKYPALHELVFDYYLPTWVGTAHKRAIFSPSMWNHGRVDEVPDDFNPADPLPIIIAEGKIDHPLTTNSLESSHRTLNAIGHKHGKKFWHVWVDVREFLGSPYSRSRSDIRSRFRREGTTKIQRVLVTHSGRTQRKSPAKEGKNLQATNAGLRSD
jgi:hypothetical protein